MVRRRIALLLCLALALVAPAAAAPAPLPPRQAKLTAQQRERLMGECLRRLVEMKVTWKVADEEGGRLVYYSVAHPSGNSAMGSAVRVVRGDLLAALQRIIRRVEGYFQDPNRP